MFYRGETLAATSGPLLECKEYGPSDLIPIRQSAANLLKRGPKPHLEDEVRWKMRWYCSSKTKMKGWLRMLLQYMLFLKNGLWIQGWIMFYICPSNVIIWYWHLRDFVFTWSMHRWGAMSRKDLQILWPVVLASNSCWIITYCTLFAWGC